MKMYSDPNDPTSPTIDEVDYCQMLHMLEESIEVQRSLMETIVKMSKEMDRLREESNMRAKWDSLFRLEADQIRAYANGHRHISITKNEAEKLKGMFIEVFVRVVP